MDIFDNPFYVLGVGPRSSREEIAAAADQAELAGDPERAAAAAAALANPRRRLTAEVFFLPGMARKNADDLLDVVKGAAREVQEFQGAPPCAAVNLTAARLSRLDPKAGAEGTSDGIVLLSRAFEGADAAGVMRDIDADRRAAGMPPVRSISDVEEDLNGLGRYCRQAVKEALDRLPAGELVEAVRRAAASETGGGTRPAPVIVRDMLEIYDVETMAFFSREEATVQALLGALKAVSAARGQPWKAAAVGEDLSKVLLNWKRVAAPLLIRWKGTGLMHKSSHRLALDVRAVTVEIHNSGGDPELARRMTRLLASVFGAVPEVNEVLDEDAKRLGTAL
ncbi:MAG: hypothetical protein LBW85_13380 [Deltaproteobacteria bacterium]|jgi:hypothetical protein|nr:hypothetical protein [Deltaproteobacteria bacterium]